MVRTSTRLHSYQTGRLTREELQNLPACKPPAKKLLPCKIRAVSLKNRLRDIQTDCANFLHGRLLFRCSTHLPWHINAVGGRPPHHHYHEADHLRRGVEVAERTGRFAGTRHADRSKPPILTSRAFALTEPAEAIIRLDRINLQDVSRLDWCRRGIRRNLRPSARTIGLSRLRRQSRRES